jgi:ankyrin repeat protein
MAELNAAIASIPSYIAQCTIFVVFAPTCIPRASSSCTVATSYVTWRRRGWTRFEFLLAKLTAVPKVCLVVRSGSATPVLGFAPDTFKLLPGEGEFSCCRLNHRINDLAMECDKPKLREVLERFVAAKVKALREQGRQLDWRFYFAARNYLTRGLLDPRTGSPSCEDETDPVESLRRSLAWSDSDDAAGERSGWTLLKFAVLSDDVAAVKALLSATKGTKRRAVGIDQPLLTDGPHLGLLPKFTNLHLAMLLASPPLVKLLIDVHASVTAVDGTLGCNAVHWASMYGRIDNVACLLDALPNYNVDTRARLGGLTALQWAAYMAPYPRQRAMMRMLLDRGASPFSRGFNGRTLLHSIAVSDDCDAALIHEILAWYAASQPHHAKRIDADSGGIDERVIPTTFRWTAMYTFCYWSWRLGKRGNFTNFFACMYKATALQLAICRNDHFAVSSLIEAGANPGAVNALGYDAEALLQVLGGSTDLLELVRAVHPKVPKSGAVFSAPLASSLVRAATRTSGWFGGLGRRRPNLGSVRVAPAPGTTASAP